MERPVSNFRGYLLRPTLRQRWADAYLTRHGFRFLVDYGYQNAYAIARRHWVQHRRKRTH
jgi:hypothetical protein